jgi:hypothetical protein
MDPNETLRMLRERMAEIERDEYADAIASEAAEHFRALDGWLTRGRLPADRMGRPGAARLEYPPRRRVPVTTAARQMEREKYDMERGQAIGYVWGRADGSGQPAGDSLAFGDHWVAYLTAHEGKSRNAIDTVYEQWRAQ